MEASTSPFPCEPCERPPAAAAAHATTRSRRLLIGGGSGLAHVMSMIRHWAETGLQAPALLLLSARTWAHVLFREELLGARRAIATGVAAASILTSGQPPAGVGAFSG